MSDFESEDESRGSTPGNLYAETVAAQYGPTAAALLQDRSMNKETFDNIMGWALKFVRVFIGVENRHQVITRTGVIQKVFDAEKENRPMAKWQAIYPFVQAVLKDTFGMELVPLPKKAANPSKRQKKNPQSQQPQQAQQPADPTGSQTHYVLVNTLPASVKEVIAAAFASGISQYENVSDLEISDINTRQPGIIPRPVSDVVESGFKSLIVCIIAIHENHISKQELFQILEEQFKISTHQTTTYEFLSRCNMDEFMTLMDRQEYVTQEVTKAADNSGDFVEYSLGRRARAEFGKDEMVMFLRELYGELWDDQKSQEAEFTLGQVFRDELSV